jgi:hypothetical protein
MTQINLLDEPLVRGLLDETIPFHEVMATHNVKTRISCNLRGNIKGFVYVSKRGYYHIFLNGKLTFAEQCHTFVHELKHIIQDLPHLSYYIGIDMQHEDIEDDTEIVDLLFV